MNGDMLEAKGFGISGTVRGPLVVLVAVMLAATLSLGFVIWKKADEAVAAAATTGRMTTDQHVKLTEAIERLSCATWYTPGERKAIRILAEKNPQSDLRKMWCP